MITNFESNNTINAEAQNINAANAAADSQGMGAVHRAVLRNLHGSLLLWSKIDFSPREYGWAAFRESVERQRCLLRKSFAIDFAHEMAAYSASGAVMSFIDDVLGETITALSRCKAPVPGKFEAAAALLEKVHPACFAEEQGEPEQEAAE